MASSTGTDPAKKVSAGADAVKAGYWFSKSELKVENINSQLFTHLYAGFAKVQYPIPAGKTIDDVIDIPDIKLTSFPDTVKKTNPGVEALLSIGGEGPDDESTDSISAAITSVVRNAETGLRDAFIKKSIGLAREHKYDGLDLCWLYPSNAYAKLENDLVSFLKDWRKAVDADAGPGEKKLLLTAAVFHQPVKDGFHYPVDALSAYLDRINVLAIDFYTPSNSELKTGPVHAWKNGSAGIANWIKSIDPATQKLVLGLPFYGYEWTLDDPNVHDFFAPAHPKTKERVSYKNIEATVTAGIYQTKYDDKTYVATYSYNIERNWIGYDHGESISEKVRKASENKLGGYFAWHVGGDDDKWTLSNAAFNA